MKESARSLSPMSRFPLHCSGKRDMGRMQVGMSVDMVNVDGSCDAATQHGDTKDGVPCCISTHGHLRACGAHPRASPGDVDVY